MTKLEFCDCKYSLRYFYVFYDLIVNFSRMKRKLNIRQYFLKILKLVPIEKLVLIDNRETTFLYLLGGKISFGMGKVFIKKLTAKNFAKVLTNWPCFRRMRVNRSSSSNDKVRCLYVPLVAAFSKFAGPLQILRRQKNLCTA